MWDYVDGDAGNLSWLVTAAKSGSAVIMTDGSFNHQLCETICETEWIILCMTTKHLVYGSFFEQSTPASFHSWPHDNTSFSIMCC